VGIVVYLAKSGQVDLRSLARLFRVWPLTLAAFAVFLLDVGFMAVRISLLFRAQRLSLSLWNAIQLTFVGFLFSTFLPGAAGGDLAKLFYASRENEGRRAEVVTILLFDRMIGMFSLIALPLLFAPFFLDLLRSAPVLARLLWMDGLLAAGLFAGMILAIFFEPFHRLAASLSSRWLGANSIVRRILDTMAAYGKTRFILLAAFSLSLLANLALIGVTALGLYAVSPHSFSARLCLVAPIGHLVNSLPLTPGGIGVGETAFNLLFSAAGISHGAESLLCFRLWNVLVSLLGLGSFLFGMGRIVHKIEPPVHEELPEYAEAGSTN
jgi:hypothetical protein